MIYRSNLKCPDLQPYFKHTVCRVMSHSQGHDVLSDFADRADNDSVFGIFKQAGFWTHDEAAILYNVAHAVGGYWLDIGGLTGWTAAHMAMAGCRVTSVDPMYQIRGFRVRASENVNNAGYSQNVDLFPWGSNEYFATEPGRSFDGIVIDGEHSSPYPLQDAINACTRIKDNGVILFHDATHTSVQDGYKYLESLGWKVKIYRTPHLVALCYRDGFVPPEHVPDPNLFGGR